MFDALRRWRENYFASKVLSSAARPIERTCLAIAHGLRSHVPRNGIKFGLPNGRVLRIGRDSGLYLASSLFWGGLDSFEPASSQALRFFFSRACTFVDVGANYGFYSLLAAHWNPNLQVIAFEPVPKIFDQLQRNIAINGFEGRISAHRVPFLTRTDRRNYTFLPATVATAKQQPLSHKIVGSNAQVRPRSIWRQCASTTLSASIP